MNGEISVRSAATRFLSFGTSLALKKGENKNDGVLDTSSTTNPHRNLTCTCNLALALQFRPFYDWIDGVVSNYQVILTRRCFFYL